jgi:hypothetical protein
MLDMKEERTSIVAIARFLMLTSSMAADSYGSRFGAEGP